MSLWIRNVIFIGIAVLILNCGEKDNRIVLSSEAVGSSSYIIDEPEGCKGGELTALYMKSHLQRTLKSAVAVHSISFRDIPWYSIANGDFYVSFSIETRRGDTYHNVECRARVFHTRDINTEGNHVIRLWKCGNDEVRSKPMSIPLQCPIPENLSL